MADPELASPKPTVLEGSIQEALGMMTAALRMLDAISAPADIGAHLDAAICRVETVIEQG